MCIPAIKTRDFSIQFLTFFLLLAFSFNSLEIESKNFGLSELLFNKNISPGLMI